MSGLWIAACQCLRPGRGWALGGWPHVLRFSPQAGLSAPDGSNSRPTPVRAVTRLDAHRSRGEPTHGERETLAMSHPRPKDGAANGPMPEVHANRTRPRTAPTQTPRSNRSHAWTARARHVSATPFAHARHARRTGCADD